MLYGRLCASFPPTVKNTSKRIAKINEIDASGREYGRSIGFQIVFGSRKNGSSCLKTGRKVYAFQYCSRSFEDLHVNSV